MIKAWKGEHSLKKIIAITLLLAMPLAIFVTGCDSEEEVERLIPRDKLVYADILRFEFQRIIDGGPHRSITAVTILEKTNPMDPRFDPSYTDFVLVHSEEEVDGFPPNVIVAWPRERVAETIIENIHWCVSRTEEDLLALGWRGTPRRAVITFEEFGLSYPLTAVDLVDQWAKVNELLLSLAAIERENIIYPWNIDDDIASTEDTE